MLALYENAEFSDLHPVCGCSVRVVCMHRGTRRLSEREELVGAEEGEEGVRGTRRSQEDSEGKWREQGSNSSRRPPGEPAGRTSGNGPRGSHGPGREPKSPEASSGLVVLRYQRRRQMDRSASVLVC